MSNNKKPKRTKTKNQPRLDQTIVGNILPRELRAQMADESGLFIIQRHLVELQSLESRHDIQSTQPAQSDDEKQRLLGTLRDIALEAWRLKGKIVDPDTGEPREEMRRLSRHVESMYASIEEAGIKIVDPIDAKYDSGMALKVISFEEKPGIMKEEIIETFKPTLIYQGKFLQVGEVIVGTPVKEVSVSTSLNISKSEGKQ